MRGVFYILSSLRLSMDGGNCYLIVEYSVKS